MRLDETNWAGHQFRQEQHLHHPATQFLRALWQRNASKCRCNDEAPKNTLAILAFPMSESRDEQIVCFLDTNLPLARTVERLFTRIYINEYISIYFAITHIPGCSLIMPYQIS